ncbi:MAG: beta-mannosidase [Pedobacter sp.]|nr:MAG: beta-mannosidase [Pedobacter sp.]
MYKFRPLIILIITLFAPSIKAQKLIDPQATKETVALYKNLHRVSQQYTLFGHQDDLAYGVNWKYQPNRSDVKDLVNDYPSVYGWDIGYIEKNSSTNIDKVPFDKMRQYIKDGYERGAVITLSWHFDNPLTGGSTWDTTKRVVETILPGGVKHELFKTWLDRAANFMGSLKGSKGEAIPILFRPFHELNGDWFWWGRNKTSAEEFKAIFKFTVNYLRQEKGLHNLIIVYNTNSFADEAEFLEKYPGDDFADVLSFDKYQFDNNGEEFIRSTRKELNTLVRIAKEKNKLSAFAETGYEAVPDPKWWTGTLWPTIKDLPISYVLVWRNAGYEPTMKKMHYYAPYKGQASANDFKKFYQLPNILFEKSTKKQNLYQN